MTDQTPAQAEQQPAPEASQQQSLESLYAEYNVPTPQQPAAPVNGTPGQPAAPIAEQQPAEENVAALHREVAAVRQELASARQQTQLQTQEADLKKAIATLGKEAGLDGKDLMLRGFLIAKAEEDQRLRTLWEKRQENPQAWKKALSILAVEAKGEFAVPNPQLEENQRAMEESQRAGSSVAPPAKTAEQKAEQMNEAEFNQFWMRLAGRG